MARQAGVCRSILIALLSALTLRTPSARAQAYIFGRADFPTGANPSSVATGDFNGDGSPDLAVANSKAGTVSILLGKADGTLGTKVDVAVGTSPSAVIVADFNHDGILDLAVTNSADNTVSILLGNGDGSFQGHVDYPTGGAPSALAVGDFNRDGVPDLAVADKSGNAVSILLGKGDGSFAPHTDYPAGNSPTSLAAGDFNGDGAPDLVVAGAGAVILLGKGDGSFGAPGGVFCGGTGPESVAVGDLNQDGKLDVAVADATAATVCTPLGIGDGTFGYVYQRNTASAPSGVALADLNGDGLLDIVTSNQAGSVSVMIQFPSAPSLVFARRDYPVTGALSALALGDFNGDGRIDVVTTNSTRNLASVFIGDGDGSLQIYHSIELGDPRASSLVVGDFNGDGKSDIIVPGVYFAYQPTTYLSNGNGTFKEVTATGTLLSGSSATGDFNGDGKLDLTMRTWPTGSNINGIAVLLGNGDGTFGGGPTLGSSSATGPLLPGDFNGDGKLDLIYYDTSGTVLVLGNGNGTFGPPIGIPSSGIPVLAADFNGDGKLDLIHQISQGALSILLGLGDGTFSPPSTITPNGGAAITGDFNRDGKLDLAILNAAGVTVLLGNGNGTFQSGVNTAATGSLLGAGDFNHDGVTDLIVATSPNLSVLYGNGDGTFRADLVASLAFSFVLYNQLSVVTTVAADLNGDGLPDVAVLSARTPLYALSVLIGPAVIALSPTLLSFPSTVVGDTSAPLNFTLSNPGAGSLSIAGIAAAGDFSQTNNCRPLLASGGGCTVSITFSPSTKGPRAGTVTITDSSPTSPQTVALNGSGLKPNAADATLSATSLAFPAQLLGTASAPKAVTLTNYGTGTLTISSIAVSGDFTQTNTCGGSVPSRSSCALNVTFRPTAPGTRTGQLVVTDNASTNPQIVSLSGIGLGPSVNLSTSSLAFGSVTLGSSSAPQTITLTNSGNSILNITNISLGGTNSGDFTQTNTCSNALAASTSCTLSIKFTPVGPGARTATIAISDNALDSPQGISLTGTGTGPVASLTPGSYDFGSVMVGASASTLLALANSGNAVLTVSGIAIGGTNSGDFSQTNNCGQSVAAGASCTITVAFKPTASGTRSATVSVTDNAQGSPHTAALTGPGADFSLSVSPLSATISAGQTVTYTLSIAPAGGFSIPTTLSCAEPPTLVLSTCSVSPQALTPNGSTVATATVTVTTTAPSQHLPRPHNNSPATGRQTVLVLALWLVMVAILSLRTAKWRKRALAGLAVLMLIVSLWAACGGGGGHPFTRAGTYTLTVTAIATSGSATLTHDANLTLQVN